MFDMVMQIFGKVVCNGSCIVSQQQFYVYWVFNDIGCVNDYCIQVVGINIVMFKQGYNIVGCIGMQVWCMLVQMIDIIRMKIVYVFIWCDMFQYFNVVDVCW